MKIQKSIQNSFCVTIMAARRSDVFFLVGVIFMIYVSFLVSKPNFCTSDGISVTFMQEDTKFEESFTYSVLFIQRKLLPSINTRRKSLFCLLLLVCGDVERCPGPSLFSNKSDFTYCIRTFVDFLGKRMLSKIIY